MNANWIDGKITVKQILVHNVFTLTYFGGLLVLSFMVCNSKAKEADLVACIIFLLTALVLFYFVLREVAIVTVLVLIFTSPIMHVTNAKYIDTNKFETATSTLTYVKPEYIIAPKLFDNCVIISCRNKYYIYPM